MRHVILAVLLMSAVGCASTAERLSHAIEVGSKQDRPRAVQVTTTEKGASIGYGPASLVVGTKTTVISVASGANEDAPPQQIEFRNSDAMNGVIASDENSESAASTEATLSITVKPSDAD